MDLDTAYIEPFIHDWVEHIQQLAKEQEQKLSDNKFNTAMPFIAILPSTVKTAFKIAEYLELKPNVKYMAIQLYDKFMCCQFWKVYKTELKNGISEASWIAICKKISQKTKLYLMSCFQLACKMDSASNNLGISLIRSILRLIDSETEYTQNMIFASEMEVFKMVDFKMPFCTPFQCIEIFLAVTGLRESPNTLNISLHLLDLTYLKHDTLYSQFHFYYVHKTNSNIEYAMKKVMLLKSNVLFLSAVVVLCTTLFLKTNVSKDRGIMVAKLAELSNTKDTDIFGMANILLLIATQE
ncbi:hypothetical protein DMN91_010945 [Ooceraea biroi]|uniref:Uncharacterized protein n=1 Tax=Ooceraea biroi TaxID=2015173 RepID=A0A3L8D983_OOCBI|nr:uncharacterized protein LOC105280584 isoform X2 [Ooceraea biroi]RLU16876.1 hypothetical protein DMN91_010945 [Ooceraea biroi]